MIECIDDRPGFNPGLGKRKVGPMVVWLVEQGEYMEGGTVLGVYSTRPAAWERAQSVARSMKERTPWHSSVEWRHDHNSSELDTGCDWLRVTGWLVQVTP